MSITSRRILNKPIWAGKEMAIAVHQNISGGYYEVSPKGEKTYVPYTALEKSGIHYFISPSIRKANHIRWTKTNKWKDRKAAKASKWRCTPIFGGLNTSPK